MPGKILGGAAEVYFKPSTGQLVIRKIGLNKDSDAWRRNTVPRIAAFQSKMTGKNIAGACKGKKARAFFSCLASKGREAWGSA